MLAVAAMLIGSIAYADKPVVAVGDVQVVAGTFDAVRAGKVVKTAQSKILGCFTAGGGDGTALAKLKLGADGKVTSATVSGLASGETDPVQNCIADALTGLRFPAPKPNEVVDLAVALTYRSGRAVVLELGEVGGLEVGGGGGGAGWGTIGIGRIGTLGKGGGYGVGGIRGASTTVTIGQPTTKGGELDTAIIRRYVKRNVMKIEYCHEKELLATPKLAGTVRAQFTIDAMGNVRAATATGMNANVASCVVSVLEGIEFPKPKQGEVIVSYPFTFSSPPARAKTK